MKTVLTSADKSIICADMRRLEKAASGTKLFRTISFETDTSTLDCEVAAINTHSATGEMLIDIVNEDFNTITCSTFEEVAEAVNKAMQQNYKSVTIRTNTKMYYCKVRADQGKNDFRKGAKAR